MQTAATTNHAALTASPRLSATIANETAPSTAIPVHKIFVCHPVVSVKMPIALLPWCSASLKRLAGANITTVARAVGLDSSAARAWLPRSAGLLLLRSDDMAHVLRSGGMSEDDIRAWKGALESSASADELKAVIGRGIERVNARLADLQARYRRGAKAPPELLSPN